MGQARPEAAPDIFGRYQTLFRIAAGGMAEVYAARVRGEAGFQKLVALKRMLPHLTDDERFVTMFMDEGKLASNISSPNVVSTLDLGRADDGSLFLVMELVVGTTLSTLLRNAAKESQSAPIDVAVEMLAQAAQGLHDAHEAKTPFGAPLRIVHRDISPQNILVGTDGRVRITDFGVARAILRRTKTSTGEFKGKLSYFSPEQCADKDLDQRSDIFSLGVVAWETLTTRRLFHAENPLAVLERVTRMPIPSADTVCPEVPPEVAAVVALALERDRDVRFDTAAEFAQALREAARNTVGVADREKISQIVTRYGGESLERVQTQLKRTLASPARPPLAAPVDDDKTEISSGIVIRHEDGPIRPATPRPPVHQPASFDQPVPEGLTPPPSFLGDPRAQPTAAAEESKSKAPLIIATIVAVLGLSAGAVIGVMATKSAEQEPIPIGVIPLADGEESLLALDPPLEEPSAIDEEAEDEALLDEEPPAPEPPRRRGATRRGADRTAPAPQRPRAEPAAVQDAPVIEPPVAPRPAPRAESRPRPSPPSRQPDPEEARPAAPPPRAASPLRGLGDFEADINRQR